MTSADLHRPEPLQSWAVLAWLVLVLQLAPGPHSVVFEAYTQALRCAGLPSQPPPQMLPSVVQGLFARAVTVGAQVPLLAARLHASHCPSQPTSQHTPSAQTLVAHSEAVLQASPLGFPTQVPLAQMGVFPVQPPQQVATGIHEPLQSLVCPVHAEPLEPPVAMTPPVLTRPPAEFEPPTATVPPATCTPPVATEPPAAAEPPVLADPPGAMEPPVGRASVLVPTPPVPTPPAAAVPLLPPIPVPDWVPPKLEVVRSLEVPPEWLDPPTVVEPASAAKRPPVWSPPPSRWLSATVLVVDEHATPKEKVAISTRELRMRHCLHPEENTHDWELAYRDYPARPATASMPPAKCRE